MCVVFPSEPRGCVTSLIPLRASPSASSDEFASRVMDNADDSGAGLSAQTQLLAPMLFRSITLLDATTLVVGIIIGASIIV